jgi:aspartyl-tRNA(Asn)/glutamyl-tRNA(Gln) amidotransferase subunit C
MSENPFHIDYLADLARIKLTPEEKSEMQSQLAKVIDYIDQLNQLDVTGIEPTSHPFPMNNVTRPDEIKPSLTQEDALFNAPAKANGLFIVPKIVE